jgi:hypothetical protein
VLQVPAEGIQCWRSPLPCTPYPHDGLALRDPGDPERGFVMTSGTLAADLHGDPPPIFELSPDVGLNLVGGFGGLVTSRLQGWRGVEARRRITTMGPEGRFLLYVDEPTTVAVRLVPRVIRLGREEVPRTALEVRLEQELIVQRQLELATATDFELELERGFQLITLRVGEPGEIATSDAVPRGPRWNVTFASIEIRSVR